MSSRPRAATLPDVARAAGVSTATAARALGGYGSVGEKTRRAVLDAAERLGYRRNELASSMVTGRTRSLGLVVGDIENPFFSTLSRAAIDAAHEAGFDMLVANTDESADAERSAVQVLLEKQADGLLVAPVSPGASDHLRALAERGVPLVLVDGHLEGARIDAITAENESAAATAVDLLLAAGHRRIAVIARSPSEQAGLAAVAPVSRSGGERVEGFRRALLAAGVAPDPAYLRHGGLRIEDAGRAVAALLELPAPPTAILTTNSTIMLGVLAELRRRGLGVPGDLSVVTFDDPPWAAHLEPPLTAIAQPTRLMGELAVRTLVARVRGDDAPRTIRRLPTELRERASIAPPRIP